MVKKTTSIQINGKRYDALTGNLLHDPIVPRKNGTSVDGVSARPHTTVKMAPLPASQVPRAKAAHAKARQAAPSATLMRHVVTKPTTPSLKRRAKVSSAIAVHQPASAPSTRAVAKKLSVHGVNHQRLARASKTPTSPRVARFGHEVSRLPIAAEQALQAIDNAFVLPESPVRPTVVFRAESAQAVTAARKTDIFEQALLRATSHEQPAVTPITKKGRRALRSLRRRMVSYGAGAMAVLAIAGFISFTSGDNIKFHMASRGAGFSATMPAYKPKGYDLASVKTVSGFVNVSYVRTAQDVNKGRTYAITQKQTSWDSQALLNTLTADQPVHSTLKSSNGPVYLYGRNQAAWVNQGVLYQVLGNGALTTQDFNQIASSM